VSAPAHAPHGPTLFGRCLYRFAASAFHAAFRTVWRLRVKGLENIPREGGILFAPHHASWADPPLVGAVSPRMIHFMAKQELFEIPVFGWLIRQVNAFPLRRAERDVGAFRTAQRLLDAGGALIIFPEGTRQKTGELGRAKAGVGMLSIKTGRPVVPVYIHNSHRFRSFGRLGISFGKPMSPAPGENDYQAFADRVMAAIAALKEDFVGSDD
jgi:1-acyl-sn-glycerol-3-phosphate acyltransferase